jgi:hypothetical protein
VKALRRALVPSLAVLLAASAGLVAPPAASSSLASKTFYVSASGGVVTVKAPSTLAAFGPEEELLIEPYSRGVFLDAYDFGTPSGFSDWQFVADDWAARAFCAFGDNKVHCYPGYLAQVRVDFRSVVVNTTVVMAEGTSVPLAFMGGSGPDYVQGGSADDFLFGHMGNDRLYGGPGDDYLDGGPGDDYLEGESGRDDMVAGLGRDSIDAADGTADFRVDCGGVPNLLDFDKGLDVPTNCGANPKPIPPAPIEPVDRPAPGQGDGTVDGVPVEVEVKQGGDEGVTIEVPQGGMQINTGLTWSGEPGAEEPHFPNSDAADMDISPVAGDSDVNVSVFSSSDSAGTAGRSDDRVSLRSKPLETVTIRANSQGRARGKLPVPAGQKPGNFVVQINAVTAAGAQLTVNVGVVLSRVTPAPDPGPTESISITSAKRGKGKKAAVITVTGTATGLAGKSVTPRYRVKGAKKWVLGKPVAVTANGSFTWRHTSAQAISITMTSGAITSKPVTVAAARR